MIYIDGIEKFESTEEFKLMMVANPYRAFDIMAKQLGYKYDPDDLPAEHHVNDWFPLIDELNKRANDLVKQGYKVDTYINEAKVGVPNNT